MKIIKKAQCNKCKTIVSESGSCECGNLTIVNGNIVLKEGIIGIDAVDISPQLLNENN